MEDQNVQTQTAPEMTFTQRMQEAVFGEATAQPAQQQHGNDPAQTQQQTQQETEKKEEFDYLDPNDWLKNEFKDYGWENVEKAKQDISEWRKAKETPVKEEIKFENEDSRKLYEALSKGERKQVLNILRQQEELSELATLELNDSSASKVVKTAMKFKYPDLTDSELDYKFNKQFGVPSKPVQDVNTETDEDYALRLKNWEERVTEAKMELMIEAKLSKPELEKYKANLVLPDIQQKQSQSQQPSPEDLANAQKIRDEFLSAASKSLNSFNGFSAKVEDKDVNFAVNYGLSQEEKSLVDTQIKQFAESGFDANFLFADRWVTNDGQLNVAKITEDLLKLHYGDKAMQKFATDSASQRLELYLKDKKNINLGQQDQFRQVPIEGKTQSQKLQESFWG